MSLQRMLPIPAHVAARIKALISSGAPQPEVISAMRASGLHIADCIRLTRDLYDISLGKAKRIVHDSDAWASMRGEYDAFHDRAIETLVQAGFEVTEQSTLQKAS